MPQAFAAAPGRGDDAAGAPGDLAGGVLFGEKNRPEKLEILRLTWGRTMENYGKHMENIWKTMEQIWKTMENYGNI